MPSSQGCLSRIRSCVRVRYFKPNREFREFWLAVENFSTKIFIGKILGCQPEATKILSPCVYSKHAQVLKICCQKAKKSHRQRHCLNSTQQSPHIVRDNYPSLPQTHFCSRACATESVMTNLPGFIKCRTPPRVWFPKSRLSEQESGQILENNYGQTQPFFIVGCVSSRRSGNH